MSWKSLNHQESKTQGKILGYTLYITAIDNVNASFQVFTIGNNKTIFNLWPFTRYNISVAGFTKVGNGPRSKYLLLKTNGKGKFHTTS